MPIRFIHTLLLGLSCLAVSANAAEPANEATLSSGGKRLVFKNFVAVRGESYKEPRIIVLATGQKVSAEVLKKFRTKTPRTMSTSRSRSRI